MHAYICVYGLEEGVPYGPSKRPQSDPGTVGCDGGVPWGATSSRLASSAAWKVVAEATANDVAARATEHQSVRAHRRRQVIPHNNDVAACEWHHRKHITCKRQPHNRGKATPRQKQCS